MPDRLRLQAIELRKGDLIVQINDTPHAMVMLEAPHVEGGGVRGLYISYEFRRFIARDMHLGVKNRFYVIRYT